MNDDDLPLFERFTLYFDFLGTSDVATNWSKERLYEFLDLLTSIAHIQSEQDIDGSPQGDGSYRFTITRRGHDLFGPHRRQLPIVG